MVKIFLDPGHGGSDSGAVGNGLQEKNLTLQIARRVRNILEDEYENVTIRMSRTGDQTVSLDARTNAANNWGADYYLSIHINAGGGTGFESYIYPSSPSRTRNEQEDIHTAVMKQINIRDRGMKQANFHVLRESNMSALLTENGFIDNKNDANQLKKSSFINSLARGHANGLAKALNLKKKSNQDPPREDPGDGGTPLYKVQIGAYSVKENADDQAKRARDAGFDVYIERTTNPTLFKVQIGAFTKKANADDLAERARKAGFKVYIYRENQ